MANERMIVGAMSGTSADGVDAALVRIGGRGLEMTASLLAHEAVDYDAGLRDAIFALRRGGTVALAELARLGERIAQAYARAVKGVCRRAGVDPAALDAVAAHGQTLFHDPPYTIQWIDPALLAAETGCAVISDFRRADCAAGGQGAPLVPFADYILFRDAQRHRILVNIGGIANVTIIPAGATIERVTAYDTGPGNCISDYLMRQAHPGGPGFDRDGALAESGKVDADIVDAVCSHPYFAASGHKSTDIPAMIAMFEDAIARRGRRLELADTLATAAQITARNILRAADAFGGQPFEMYVSGGGTRNRRIMKLLKDGAAHNPVRIIDELGIPSAAKEALAFALLGAATLDGAAGNVPSATGARRAVVLGCITPAP